MNLKTSLLALPFICMLGACQTTGTTTAAIPNGLMPSDSQMSCAEIQNEFAQLDQIITAAGGAQTSAQMTNAGVGVAQNAAIWGGAGSSVPLLGSFGNIASTFTNAQVQTQQQQAQAATNRRNQLLGLAQGKGCM